MAYRWGITESGCDDDREGDGRTEGEYNIHKARNKGKSVLYILSAPAAAVVSTMTEAHLLVKELPEPAAVELREWHKFECIQVLNGERQIPRYGIYTQQKETLYGGANAAHATEQDLRCPRSASAPESSAW